MLLEDKVIVAQEKKGGMAYAVTSLVFSVLSLLFLVIDLSALGGIFAELGSVGMILIKVIFAIGFVFFGYGFFYLLKRTQEGKPLLMVDENGVTDNSSSIAVGFIPWKDIEDVYLQDFMGQRFIDLKLRNEDYYIGKLPAWKQKMVKANLKMGMQLVSITLNSTKQNPQQVCERMQAIFKKVKEQ